MIETIEHEGNKEHQTICRNPVFITLKVQIFHPDTGRKTWRKWNLCERHFSDFYQKQGEGYFVHYRKKADWGDAPVIHFEMPII